MVTWLKAYKLQNIRYIDINFHRWINLNRYIKRKTYVKILYCCHAGPTLFCPPPLPQNVFFFFKYSQITWNVQNRIFFQQIYFHFERLKSFRQFFFLVKKVHSKNSEKKISNVITGDSKHPVCTFQKKKNLSSLDCLFANLRSKSSSERRPNFASQYQIKPNFFCNGVS